MPKRQTPGAAAGRDAKNALFGGEPFVVKPAGKRQGAPSDTSKNCFMFKILNLCLSACFYGLRCVSLADLIGGIDAGEDKWQSAASHQVIQTAPPLMLALSSVSMYLIQISEKSPGKPAKKLIPRSSGGIGLEVTSGVQYIIRKLKEQLASRGARGFSGLQRKFKIMDDDGNKSLDVNEFSKAMRESGLSLSDTEVVMLFAHFDRDGSKSVSFDEFLVALRVSYTALARSQRSLLLNASILLHLRRAS